jgi:hypothetical protein
MPAKYCRKHHDGGMSKFHRGESTLAQRVWTMLWLATGLSIFFRYEGVLLITKMAPDWVGAPATLTALFFLLFTPDFGGFVVMGQMLRSYGNCVALS